MLTKKESYERPALSLFAIYRVKITQISTLFRNELGASVVFINSIIITFIMKHYD